MVQYKVYHSKRFDGDLGKFDKDFHEQVDKIENQLMENPYLGDSLSLKWFREKRIREKRIYFLVYDDLKAVFMVAISGKKDQQRVINTIRLLLESFRKELDNLANEEFI